MYLQRIIIFTVMLLSGFVVQSDCQSKYSDSIKSSLGKLFSGSPKCNLTVSNAFSCSGSIQSFKQWKKANYKFEIHILCSNTSDVRMNLSALITSNSTKAIIEHTIGNGKTNIPISFTPSSINGTLIVEMNMFLNNSNNDLDIQSSFTLDVSNIGYKKTESIAGFMKKLTCKNVTTDVPISTTSIISNNIKKSTISATTTTQITSTKSTATSLTTEKKTTISSTILHSSSIMPSIITTTRLHSSSIMPSTTTTTRLVNKKESHSKPAKVVLLVLALLIIIAVVGIYIYFKRKRRLSNQPAYYNDIAINDPLRSLVSEEEEETNHTKDDDELLLFA